MVCLSCAQRGPGEKDDMQRTAGHNHQGSLFASIYFGMDGEFLGGGSLNLRTSVETTIGGIDHMNPYAL